MGLDEQLFGSGVCVIEWAERAEELLPEDALWIEFSYGESGDEREIALETEATRYDELLAELDALSFADAEISPPP